MSNFVRILVALFVAVFVVGPVSAATTSQAAPMQVAQNAGGSLSGTVDDQNGVPVSNAHVQLRGHQTYDTYTDDKGNYSFPNVDPGIYSLTITRPGFNTQVDDFVGVTAGQAQQINAKLQPISFTSLRTIATIRSVGPGTFNTTSAAVNVVTAQTFTDQGQVQVNHVLDQLPGVQISTVGNSVNGASPGSISFPNVRDARSYETATLIDGHPVFVGGFGDYVTTFLNAETFGSVEVIKGPGATAPQINGAIGGTVNFITKDPTLTPTPDYFFGITSHGGTAFNFGFSNTINNRLGFVADYAYNNDPSAINGQKLYFNNFGNIGFQDQGAIFSGTTQTQPIPGTSSSVNNGAALILCCTIAQGTLESSSELLKLKYKLSDATNATVTYLGNQATADQFANNANITNTTFLPYAAGNGGAPAYTGSIPVGTVLPVAFVFPSPTDYETNNEPIIMGEIGSTLGSDTVDARYYHAAIQRLQFQGPNDPNQPDMQVFQAFGNQQSSPSFNNPPLAFNGGMYTFQNYDYFRSTESDSLSGYSFQYNHPLTENNMLTLSFDRSIGQSLSYDVFSPSVPFPGQAPGGAFIGPPSIPPGSNQAFTTYLLRDSADIGSRLHAILSLYSNQYATTTNNSGSCQFDGSGCTFETQKSSHADARLGLEWRPASDLAVRLGAGSSVAPPFLGLLTTVSDKPPFATNAGDAFETVNFKNPHLAPETSFGYDLGFDKRMRGQTYVSFDAYQTNLFNSYFQRLTPSGLTCASTPTECQGPGTGNPNIPIYDSEVQNLANVRFEGLELSVKRVPDVGLGWSFSGGTQRAYAYNLPPCFYSTNPANCNEFDTNLNVVPGVNFNGGYASFLPLPNNEIASTNVSSQNQSVPYLTGNIGISYKLRNGAQAEFGETLLGKNNSYNEPPFGIAYASIRYPINDSFAVQISGDNIFNAYPGLFPVAGTGVPIGLANGQSAATVGNVVGPASYRFMLVKRVGN